MPAAWAQNMSQSPGLPEPNDSKGKESSLGGGCMQPQVVSQRGNTRCTRGYTLIQDLLNGDTEGLFPSQLGGGGGIRDMAEVTQSDLKAPDVVPITTFHGSLDFNLFYLFFPLSFSLFIYTCTIHTTSIIVSYVIVAFIHTENTH